MWVKSWLKSCSCLRWQTTKQRLESGVVCDDRQHSLRWQATQFEMTDTVWDDRKDSLKWQATQFEMTEKTVWDDRQHILRWQTTQFEMTDNRAWVKSWVSINALVCVECERADKLWTKVKSINDVGFVVTSYYKNVSYIRVSVQCLTLIAVKSNFRFTNILNVHSFNLSFMNDYISSVNNEVLVQVLSSRECGSGWRKGPEIPEWSFLETEKPCLHSRPQPVDKWFVSLFLF